MFGVLIDMDGVIYRGADPIPGAIEFVNNLVDKKVPFLFLTNNSQRTRLDIAMKISRLGFKVGPAQIYTCGNATARFLARQKPHCTAFVLGETGLTTALHQDGIAVVDKDPDFVVVGEGRTYTFEMLEQATNLVLKGAKLIATNMDPNCPTATGTRPGCGAIVKLLEEATGVKAFSIGKPNPIMMRDARKILGFTASNTFMIGDTMETDILGGLQLGYHTILVLSGGTTEERLPTFAYQPDRVVKSVANLSVEYFEEMMAQRAAAEQRLKEFQAAAVV
jgi:NagD protein